MRRIIAIFLILYLSLSAAAQTVHPPLEAYGQLDQIAEMAISPDGKHLAYLARRADGHLLVVRHLETADTFGVRIDDLKTEDLSWLGNRHVILRASDARRLSGLQGKLLYSGAFAFNIEKRRIRQLLLSSEGLYKYQEGLGRIVGLHDNEIEALMPAFTGDGGKPDYSLLRVNLDTGVGRILHRGRKDGKDWIVGGDGTIIAQERYDEDTDHYQLRTAITGELQTILEFETAFGPRGLIGVMPDFSALLVLVSKPDGFDAVRKLSFDGTFSDDVVAQDDAEISQVLSDSNRVVHGVRFGGMLPSYEFFDADLTRLMKSFTDRYPDVFIDLVSWSDGFEKLIVRFDGTEYPGDYFLIDRASESLSFLSSARPGIAPEAMGMVEAITYAARDGVEIPAILTTPPDRKDGRLPTIILPHGGPESHDRVGFDFIAQYFANRGYLVLQPNFRGSTGFGRNFTEAGYGEWGGLMQDDLTDGLQYLVDTGKTDPDRVCIIGWSYGGYAALAGGAFTPDLYKCVAAIAPVTDLNRMLRQERRDHGADSWVVSYWRRAMASGDATKEFLRSRSPARHAENFQAAVMLIHGNDDFTVTKRQSEIMARALKSAGKTVEYINLPGEDHALLSTGARLDLLKALDGFVTTYIGETEKNLAEDKQ